MRTSLRWLALSSAIGLWGAGAGCGSRASLDLALTRSGSASGGQTASGGSVSTGGAASTGGTAPASGGSPNVKPCLSCAQVIDDPRREAEACDADATLFQALRDCACTTAPCHMRCADVCNGGGEIDTRCSECADQRCGPEVDACLARPGPGSGGSASTGGTAATGGTGGSVSTGGTGGVATGGTGGVVSTGGTGGFTNPPQTGEDCANRVIALGVDPLISSFDNDVVGQEPRNFGNHDGFWGGFYSYDDETGVQTFEVVADGHVRNGLYYGLDNYTIWGGGWGLWFECIDVSVYSGLSFWAKGNPGDVIRIHLVNPHSQSVENGGLCEFDCVAPYYRIRVSDEYRHYVIPWVSVRPGSGGDFDPRVLSTLSFQLTNPDYGEPHSGYFVTDELELLP